MFSSFIETLQINLQKPLPGLDAQFEMAHIKREKIYTKSLDVSIYKPSAVLILLYPNHQNQTSVVLIERVSYNGHHSGQIALPGGKFELTDNDLEATALREFFEETGSDVNPVIIGKLTPVYIPVSQFMVQPFVAYAPDKPIFNISVDEVKTLIEWDVTNLLNPATVKETTVEITPGLTIKAPYFEVQDKVLWGATAMILNELKWVIQQ